MQAFAKERLPKAYKQPISNIQVLTPMQRGVVGASNLNISLQAALNPSQLALNRGGYSFKLNDRVMQLRNNYDKEVFNGDLDTYRKSTWKTAHYKWILTESLWSTRFQNWMNLLWPMLQPSINPKVLNIQLW